MNYLSLFEGLALGTLLIVMVVLLGFYIIYVIGLARLFKKAGIEGWKAIIPVYNDYLFTCKVCGLHWAWFVGTIVGSFLTLEGSVLAIFRIFVKAMSFYNLAIKCNKEIPPTMIFGALFPEIVTMVYGFGDYIIDPYKEVKPSGLF